MRLICKATYLESRILEIWLRISSFPSHFLIRAALGSAAFIGGRRLLEGGARKIFEVLCGALFRGRRSLEGGAKKRKYGNSKLRVAIKQPLKAYFTHVIILSSLRQMYDITEDVSGNIVCESDGQFHFPFRWKVRNNSFQFWFDRFGYKNEKGKWERQK